MQDVKKTQKGAFLLAWCAYCIGYLCRYSYQANMVAIQSAYGLSSLATVGLVSTLLFITYSCGQLFNSIIAKKVNVKKYVFIALVSSAACNLLFFFDVPFWLFFVVWPINGFLQSMLWTPITRILILNISEEKRVKYGCMMGMSTPVGCILCYVVGFIAVRFASYKLSFLIGAISVFAIAIVWLLLRNKVFAIDNAQANMEENNSNENASTNKEIGKEILTVIISSTIYALLVAASKDGLTSWFPTFTSTKFSIDESYAILFTIGLLITAFLGSISAQKIYKLIPNLKTLNLFYFIVLTVIITVLIIFKDKLGLVGIIIVFALLMFFLDAASNTWIGILPFLYKEKQTTIAGVCNFGNHIGSAISTFAFGAVADSFGWNSIFFVILGFTVIPLILSIVLNNKKVSK